MTDPNIIDLTKVVGSQLVAAKFDRIGRNLLNLTGMTPSGRVVRLGTVFLGFDGALTPVWSTLGRQILGGWAEKVLLHQISTRLPKMPARQRERIW
jgi:hypothetical protein